MSAIYRPKSMSGDPRVFRIEPDALMSVDTVQPNAVWGLDRVDQRSLPLNSSFIMPPQAAAFMFMSWIRGSALRIWSLTVGQFPRMTALMTAKTVRTAMAMEHMWRERSAVRRSVWLNEYYFTACASLVVQAGGRYRMFGRNRLDRRTSLDACRGESKPRRRYIGYIGRGPRERDGDRCNIRRRRRHSAAMLARCRPDAHRALFTVGITAENDGPSGFLKLRHLHRYFRTGVNITSSSSGVTTSRR